jgi:hypothetical protein
MASQGGAFSRRHLECAPTVRCWPHLCPETRVRGEAAARPQAAPRVSAWVASHAQKR